MNTGDIVQLTENWSTFPPGSKRVTFGAGTHFTVRHLSAVKGYVNVTDDTGTRWALPVSKCEVVRKAAVK